MSGNVIIDQTKTEHLVKQRLFKKQNIKKQNKQEP